jgi:hypothetical protein
VRNSAIFSVVKCYEGSMVASVRIARWLQNFLEIDCFVDANPSPKNERYIGNCPEHLDTLVIVGGAFAFIDASVLQPLATRIMNARRVVWVQNDYTVVPPKDTGDATSPFRRAFVIRKNEGKPTVYWSTCEKWASLPGSSYVNWNMLTFDPAYDAVKLRERYQESIDTLLYYGSYRSDSAEVERVRTRGGVKYKTGELVTRVGKNGRDEAFRRYFSEPAVETWISSPSDKFKAAFPRCNHVPPFLENFYANIGKHGLGLYVEDVRSHEEFHSPANRFYEMLSAGLPMVFQPEAVPMLKRAGFAVEAYVARTAGDIPYFMQHRKDMGKSQRQAWIGDDDKLRFRNMLIDQVTAARSKLA